MLFMKTIFLAFVCVALPALATERANCQASTYFSHSVTGNSCIFNDEVMVGIDSIEPMRIRCARLQVNCTRPTEQSPEKTVETDSDAR